MKVILGASKLEPAGARLAAMQPHLFGFLLFVATQDWNELLSLAILQEGRGEYAQAEVTLRTALQTVEREGLPARHLATVLNNLGSVQMSLGDFLRAERTLKRSLACFREDQGQGVDWTSALSNLAQLYRLTGRLREAEDAYRRVLEARRSSSAGVGPLARSLANLAAVLIERGNLEEAGEHLQAALRSSAKLPGEELDHGAALMNLAVLRTHQGNLRGARLAAIEGVARLKTSASPSHPLVGQALVTLGDIRLRLGETAAAESDLEQAVRMLEAAYPSGHLVLAAGLFAYADALQACGKKREAKLANQQAGTMSKQQEERNLEQHKVSLTDLRKSANRRAR